MHDDDAASMLPKPGHTVCGHTLSLSHTHTQLRVRPRGSHQPTSACGPIVPPSIRYGPSVLVPPSREQVSGGAGHDADSRAPPTHASAHVSVQAHGRLQRGSVGGVHPLMHLLPPSPRAPQQHIPCLLPLCVFTRQHRPQSGWRACPSRKLRSRGGPPSRWRGRRPQRPSWGA